jgi:hypothetical protein
MTDNVIELCSLRKEEKFWDGNGVEGMASPTGFEPVLPP